MKKEILRCPECKLYLYYSGQLIDGTDIYTCKCCPGFTTYDEAIKEVVE